MGSLLCQLLPRNEPRAGVAEVTGSGTGHVYGPRNSQTVCSSIVNLQGIEPALIPDVLRDTQTHSLVPLVRDLRLSSMAMGLELIQGGPASS